MFFNRISNFLIALFLMSLSVPLGAQPYFCTNQGTELQYVRKNVRKGDVKWIHTMTIDNVVYSVDSSMVIDYSSFIEMKKGRGLMNAPVKMRADISAGGEVRMDIATSMVAVLKEFLWESAEVSAEGGITVLPYDLIPGDTLENARGAVHALGMTMNVDVTERKVIGTEILTTPAGTFDCVIVSEHKVEKGMMRNRVTTAHTWYARGVGMVRHDTYDKHGELETSEVLQSISVNKHNHIYARLIR